MVYTKAKKGYSKKRPKGVVIINMIGYIGILFYVPLVLLFKRIEHHQTIAILALICLSLITGIGIYFASRSALEKKYPGINKLKNGKSTLKTSLMILGTGLSFNAFLFLNTSFTLNSEIHEYRIIKTGTASNRGERPGCPNYLVFQYEDGTTERMRFDCSFIESLNDNVIQLKKVRGILGLTYHTIN